VSEGTREDSLKAGIMVEVATKRPGRAGEQLRGLEGRGNRCWQIEDWSNLC
jgi:hypothetical protein